jgi:hypothetical protein
MGRYPKTGMAPRGDRPYRPLTPVFLELGTAAADHLTRNSDKRAPNQTAGAAQKTQRPPLKGLSRNQLRPK